MDADILSFAAGHKALGLYSIWALRNEIARLAAPQLFPQDERDQLRIEDLLGFRRNPITKTPLFTKFNVKPLDGHPTPATPFVRLATGASGVGVASSLGLAFAAADYFGTNAPWVHIVEGEGGMTPGRVGEAMAAAGTASLGNVVMHVDWNQSSIDSDRVCREGADPGEYVQWDPMEFAYLHDWNVIYVPEGREFQQIVAAQRRACSLDNGQPTAVIYRTTKGWHYGIEGRASHGAGHKLCSAGFHEALRPLTDGSKISLPTCDGAMTSCRDGQDGVVVEECFWDALIVLRDAITQSRPMIDTLAGRLVNAKKKLDSLARKPREHAPRVEAVFEAANELAARVPNELALVPGTKTTLRGQLGSVLNFLNHKSRGALFAAAADLLDSTSIAKAADGFGKRYYNRRTNPESRLLSIGGICEDAMCGILAGISSFGRHIGAGASYGAFIAPLGHIASRLHAIGNQARNATTGEPYRPYIMVCGHAGLKTGEDGPTHADPQALQLLQDNFPPGTMITLTPWDAHEIWPLMAAALCRRPAVIAPFVTRPNEPVLDRRALGLAAPTEAAEGVYLLRRARGDGDGVVVLQGSGVAYAFILDALPLLEKAGIDLNAYYVSSVELFGLLPTERQERIFPWRHAEVAMGITGLTLPTMYRWIVSPEGRAATLHPFMNGRFLGSGQADKVIEEAGLDGRSQFDAIRRYIRRPMVSAAEAERAPFEPDYEGPLKPIVP
jgi:transketolase